MAIPAFALPQRPRPPAAPWLASPHRPRKLAKQAGRQLPSCYCDPILCVSVWGEGDQVSETRGHISPTCDHQERENDRQTEEAARFKGDGRSLHWLIRRQKASCPAPRLCHQGWWRRGHRVPSLCSVAGAMGRAGTEGRVCY